MRQDEKLLRKILCFVEKKCNGRDAINPPYFCDYTQEQVEYHVRLCHQAGWIMVKTTETLDGDIVSIRGLTYNGQQQLRKMADG